MNSVHIVVYFDEAENITKTDAEKSVALLKKHVQAQCPLRVSYELRQESTLHEKDAIERIKGGALLTGIRRPHDSQKEKTGNAVSMNFSSSLSCQGTGGLRDFCIHVTYKDHLPTLIHEFLHAIGLNPDGRDQEDYPGKAIDDSTPDHHANWNKKLLWDAAKEDYDILNLS